MRTTGSASRLLAGFLSFGGCISDAELERMDMQHKLAEHTRKFLQLLCPPEFRRSYEEIKRQCSRHVAKQLRDAPKYCTSDVVEIGLESVQRDWKLNFANIINSMPHGVAYLGPLEEDDFCAESKSSMHQASSCSLGKTRERHLEMTLGPPWPESTDFLMITNPEPDMDQALQHLKWLRGWLVRKQVAPRHVEVPLLYNLAIAEKDLRALDKPLPLEKEKGYQPIWIVPLDCPDAKSK